MPHSTECPLESCTMVDQTVQGWISKSVIDVAFTNDRLLWPLIMKLIGSLSNFHGNSYRVDELKFSLYVKMFSSEIIYGICLHRITLQLNFIHLIL